MNIELDYEPYDRVTVDLYGALTPAVWFGEARSIILPHKHNCAFAGNNGYAYGATFDESEIRPGHYDELGNWTPQPGDPCYYIDSETNEPVQLMVLGFDNKDPLRQVHTVGGTKISHHWYGVWLLHEQFAFKDEYSDDMAEGKDLPYFAILRPGRPKLNKQ